MRGDWDKKTLTILPKQDLSNYNLDTTNGFKISTPSTSTAKMARMVNLIPYKDGEELKFRKRPGCVSATSIAYSSVVDAIITATPRLYIGGNLASGSGNTNGLLTSTDGTTWAELAPATYTSGAYTVGGGVGEDQTNYLSETNVANTTYVMFMTRTQTGTPAVADTTAAFYAVEGTTYTAVTGTCSVTASSAVVTGIADTSKFAAGQVINFTGDIGASPAGSTSIRYIVSVQAGVGVTVNSALAFDTGTAYFSKGSLFRITDSDFPANNSDAIIGKFVSLNGYVYIMTVSGKVWNSDINSVTAWTASAYLTAQMNPDYGRTLVKYKNNVVAFGEKSIEFFRDIGTTPGTPLLSVPELFIKLGVRTAKHVVEMEDTICFMANADTATNSIYMFEGFEPKKISTDSVDYVISKIGPANFELKTMRLNGKLCLLVNRTLTTTSAEYITLVYYVEDNEWGEWKVTEGGTVNDYAHPWQFPMGVISGVFYLVSGKATTPGAYVTKFLAESDANYYDNLSASSKSVTVYIQTKPLTLGTLNRKFLSELRVIDSIDDSFNPSTALTVYWSDDFGVTWSTRAFASTKQFINNLGSFRERIFRFVESSTNFYQFSAIELLYKLGAH